VIVSDNSLHKIFPPQQTKPKPKNQIMNNTEKTLAEYNRIQATRAWNAKFRVPPVCTKLWTDEDFQNWLDSQKPLPPFQEWIKE
jgi:hypothetical protein